MTDTCRDNGWEFIIRYKTGSISSIPEKYERIPEKGTEGHAEFVNDMDYKGKAGNMLRFWEEKIINGRECPDRIPVADRHPDYKKECGELSVFQGKLKIGKFEVPGQAIMEFTFQRWTENK